MYCRTYRYTERPFAESQASFREGRGDQDKGRAFSLIELLIVMAVMGLLLTMAGPSVASLFTGSNIRRGGQSIEDQIILARQTAVNKNRDVEVRLIQVPASIDPMSPGYRALQVWMKDETGTNAKAITKVVKLPDNIVISPNATLSPLLTSDGLVNGTTNYGSLGNCPYKGFVIRADGKLSSAVTTQNNFLTIQTARDTGLPPVNFYVVRVNSLTGRVEGIQP